MKEKILLVDDDPSVREMLSRVLRAEDYLVLPAADGGEALKIAAATEIDLALLDLNMPVRDGWDTFERLTSDNPWIPIIIITARTNQLFPALASGAGALMEKPLDLPKLLQTIADLLSEPREVRLARMTGRPAAFRYLPSKETHPKTIS
ncbi:MAG: response regulator [Verrucomicrobia bacterium]|nr:response regulator [Verrucomicrobiota bacterium]